MASVNDKITGVRDGTARPVATTVNGSRSPGVTSLSVAATTGWDTTTKVHFQTYTKDAQGEKIASSATDWSGIVSGTTITNLTLTAGTDNGNNIGDIVECMPTAAWADELAQGLLEEHDTEGHHTDITADTLTVGSAVTLPNNSIDANELSTSAITLNYAEITASTGALANNTAVGLSVTVTIPSGGRRTRITVGNKGVQGSSANASYGLAIWDGTVGSGTQLASEEPTAHANNAVVSSRPSVIKTFAAGSKTFNIGMKASAGSGVLLADLTSRAYILVEAI